MDDRFRFALLVFAVSLLGRGAFVLYFTDPLRISDDSYHHLTIAESLYGGRGFETDVIWPLILRSDGFPQPYYYRQPAYPLMIAASYVVFGHSLFSAQLVSIICESLTAALIFLLCRELSGSNAAAAYSAAFYISGAYQLILAPQLLSDMGFTLTVVAAFYAMRRFDGRLGLCLTGCLIGVSYLTREQGLILLPAAGAYLFSNKAPAKALRDLGVIFAAALFVASPWLLRTYLLTGNPAYNFNAYGILLLKDDDRFFSGMDAPKSPPELFIERLNPKTFRDISANLLHLGLGQLILMPSVIAAFILYIERDAMRAHILLNRGFYAALAAYFAVLVAAVSMMFGDIRYLYSMMPFYAMLFGISLDGFFKRYMNVFRSPTDTAFRLAVFAIIISSNIYLACQVIGETKPLPDIEASYWLRGEAGKNDVVMAYFPFYVPYVLGAKAVESPARQEDIGRLVRQYNVTYVISGLTRKWYDMSDEPMLVRAYGDGNTTVYRVRR